MIAQQVRAEAAPVAFGRDEQGTFDRAFVVLFFISLGGLATALWSRGDVASLYTWPTAFVLLAQAGAAFVRRLSVQVRASVFTFASCLGIALALPELGTGLPVILVSAVTIVGSVTVVAKNLDYALKQNAELLAAQAMDSAGRAIFSKSIPHTDSDSIRPSESTLRSEPPSPHQVKRARDLQTLGLLAATLAHDFNNLLSVVLSNTSALRSQLPSDVEEVEEIEQVAQEAADLCKRVLKMSREPSSPMEDSSLNRLIQTELPLLRRMASGRVRVVWEPGPDLWFLASRTEFRQLLLNLCANARDAMPQGGELRLKTITSKRVAPSGIDETFACLVISDNGVGMNEATQAQMFDPFFTTKPSSKGTGLGMAVVAAAVERHKAQIEVKSELNVGTTISIYFPEVGAVDAPESIPSHSMTRELGGNETILVVEDDPRVLRAISRTLRRHGYRVLGAADGREGIAALSVKRVDLVICDWVMPVMDGPAFYREVIKKRPLLPFLFCSGAAEDSVVWEGVANDHVERISKPFTEQTLLSKVKELLASKDAPALDERIRTQMLG